MSVVIGCHLLASGVTFGLYAIDKSAARNGQWRIRESTLNTLALLGGWPGALLAQRIFRHKSRKISFQIVFWLAVLLNSGVVAWLFTSAGGAALHVMLGAR